MGREAVFERLAKRHSRSAEECKSLEATVEGLRQEISVLRQAIDEFRVDFTHLLRNFTENLPPPFQHLATLPESFAIERGADHGREASDETLCCYECDTDSLRSLAQALHDGWIDITCAEEAHGTNFVGWCPTCQRSYEEEQRRLNVGPVNPQRVKETKPLNESPKTLFD